MIVYNHIVDITCIPKVISPMPKPTGLLHKSLVQTIVETLEAKIVNGELQPGERLVEQAMCDLLAVSRAPLREAFRILENQGFLENKARKGMYVSGLSRKEAIDIYMIRANLESLATYLAVKAGGAALARELRVIHETMKDAVARGDVDCYIVNNLRFHEILVSTCGNDHLIDMLRRFNKHTARYRLRILSTPGKFQESIQRHEALLEAIGRGDAELAERIRKEGVLKNIPLVEKTFDNDGEDGGIASHED